VRFTLKHDRHLKESSVQQLLHRPALFISDTACCLRDDPNPEQASIFCSAVVRALRNRGGHVIVPVDTASRVLELLILLEQHWREKRLTYPIAFLAKCAPSILEKARIQLEFLSEKLQQVRACWGSLSRHRSGRRAVEGGLWMTLPLLAM
jgi:cleavage and polyadenylation specificity factor subunit 2